MQPLDPKSLFTIFEAGDEEVYKEHGAEDVLGNPYVIMGMVAKGVENYYIMDFMYKKRYPQEYEKVRNNIQNKYYNRLLGYLLRIKEEDMTEVYSIAASYDISSVLTALWELISYYEKAEEYEKCAKIKKYIEYVDYKFV